ncbi:hypothetical protein JYU34_010481 [Plutella xylostella]|uniref:N-acetyllactosaminide beta-1,3-N-acetylglucosaminyltransferase n=1 Tax=Plutella xylostella TaxID=51655 RepID=A0ABQ7QIN1_PLUXY|nr:hypothetical protein JYU34_010481 [Plutella xylostella]
MLRCVRICGAYIYRVSRRHSTVLLLASFILIITVILQMYAYRHADTHGLSRTGDSEYAPGAFLKGHQPENVTYCKFNYGLPDYFRLNQTFISYSPEGGEHSAYRVIYNAIQGTEYANVSKFNAVTYATQATPEFMYHVVEIARFWEGPISLAVFVPDYDMEIALRIMTHLCSCYHGMAKVSMHLFYPIRFPPKMRTREQLMHTTTETPTTTANISIEEIQQQKLERYRSLDDSSRAEYIQWVRQNKIKRMMTRVHSGTTFGPELRFSDCMGPNYLNATSFRKEHSLTYPINVGRNVARNASKTNYFLVSDIELVPSDGLAPKFLAMVRKLMGGRKREEGYIFSRTVFVVPLFEVERGEGIPRDKDELIRLAASNRAVYFHQKICSHCQRFPGLQTWLNRPSPYGVEPMVIGRREYPYHRWEPLYFGTQREPWYNELLSWEGKQDKMTQMLELCLQEYRLVVLDGGFLVHADIRQKKDSVKHYRAEKLNWQRYYKIIARLKMKYKDNPRCKVS